METTTETARCDGCGHTFRGVRGLRAHQAQRFNTLACRPRPRPVATVEPVEADIPASIASMTMNPHERAKVANAALTPEHRSAAGKARAAQLHHPTTLARRLAAKWPELSDEDRRTVRAALREAGIIK